MSLKMIKNVALVGCIGLAGLFSVSVSAAMSTETVNMGTLTSGSSSSEFASNATGSSFSIDYTFGFDATVQSGAAVSAAWQLANYSNFNTFDVTLYDATNTEIAAGSAIGVESLTFTISEPTTGLYKIHIDGIVSGAASGGAYTVNVSSVPLPAAAWLFISGFMALGGWSIFKRKREQEGVFSSNAVAA